LPLWPEGSHEEAVLPGDISNVSAIIVAEILISKVKVSWFSLYFICNYLWEENISEPA
jgi:hypothetical protein